MLESGIALLQKYLRPSCDTSFSPATMQVLEEEERNGAAVNALLRYFLTFLVFIGGIVGSGLRPSYLAVNIAFSLLFLGWAEVNRRVVRSKSLTTIRFTSFLGVASDNTLFIGMILVYWWMVGDADFSFVAKTPLLVLLVIPIVTSVIQFRLWLILFSTALGLLIIMSIFTIAMLSDIKIGSDWEGHILGTAFAPVAFLSTYPFVLLALGVVVGYAIVRSMSMVQRIGTMEAQKTALSRYFSPSVVAELTERPEEISIGRRQKVTVLFSDIRGFTALSEGMTAEEVASLLTELRRLQTEAVFEFGGTVDKFIGDAIMAVFGAPAASDMPGEDSERAVLCAKRMLEALKRFNDRRAETGHRPLAVGIGIHSGEAFAGNIGDLSRMEYTVIGDTVNTASRIESLTKKLGRTLIVSRQVKEDLHQTGNAWTLEKLPLVKVKGKELPLEVYAIPFT